MTGPVMRAANCWSRANSVLRLTISGRRLDDAGVGIGLHRGGEAHDRVAGHQAVGVEHDHVRVVRRPSG